LELKRSEDAFVFSFVTVRDDVTEITANLQGPVVLNQKKGVGRQIISEGSFCDVRFKVWDALMNIDDPSFAMKQSVECGA
jgi:flagellar assembly factor FliW